MLQVGLSSSYYLLGYDFLAKMASKEGKYQLALDLFKQGLKAYHLEGPDIRLLEEANACADRAQASEALRQLVVTPYRLWDERKLSVRNSRRNNKEINMKFNKHEI